MSLTSLLLKSIFYMDKLLREILQNKHDHRKTKHNSRY